MAKPLSLGLRHHPGSSPGHPIIQILIARRNRGATRGIMKALGILLLFAASVLLASEPKRRGRPGKNRPVVSPTPAQQATPVAQRALSPKPSPAGPAFVKRGDGTEFRSAEGVLHVIEGGNIRIVPEDTPQYHAWKARQEKEARERAEARERERALRALESIANELELRRLNIR